MHTHAFYTFDVLVDDVYSLSPSTLAKACNACALVGKQRRWWLVPVMTTS